MTKASARALSPRLSASNRAIETMANREDSDLRTHYDFSGGVRGKYADRFSGGCAVVAPENDETFTLGTEDESALLDAMAEGDRGEVISADELFRRSARDD